METVGESAESKTCPLALRGRLVRSSHWRELFSVGFEFTSMYIFPVFKIAVYCGFSPPSRGSVPAGRAVLFPWPGKYLILDILTDLMTFDFDHSPSSAAPQ